MAQSFKKADVVGITHTTMTGTVQGLAIVEDEVQFLVEYMDNSGETQQRYFTEDQLFNTVV